MKLKNLYILFHGRFPSEKAAALFAQKSAESFAQYASVTLVVPRRLFRGKPEPLPAGVRVAYVPTLDFFQVPLLSRIAFPISFLAFSLSCLVYLFTQLTEEDSVDTNESLPALVASVLTRNIIFEVHDFPERFHRYYAFLFKRVRYVLATNQWKRDELLRRFNLPKEKVFLERNGVDTERFTPGEKSDARARLGIPREASVVVYTGHLYAWKGVETLAKAAALLPGVDFYFVGGAEASVKAFSQTFSAPRIHAVGQRPHEEIPLWQSAADVLVLPNTGKEEISARYTSPMKLFEYMASGRPIVASAVPSIREVLSEEHAYLVAPDNPEALAGGIEQALAGDDTPQEKAQRARKESLQYAWSARASRIVERIQNAPKQKEGFRMAVVFCAYLAITMYALFPFLFGGQLIVGSDITNQYYPSFAFYHDALMSGQSFLWSPNLFSGFPLYLSQVGGYFDPLNYLLFSFFNAYDGLHLRLLFDYLLMTILAFFAARAWGISRAASFCVGLASLLPFNETYVSNPLFTNSMFIMPLLVWVMGKVRACAGFHFGLSIVAGMGVGYAFISGYAQPVIMALVLFGILGVLYALLIAQERTRFLLRFIGFCAVVGSVGFVVGSPQIIPALDFSELSRRGEGVGYDLASLKAVDPGDLIMFLFPDYTYFPYLSSGRVALFVGALFFLSGWLVLARVVRRSTDTMVKEARLFVLVALFALVTAFTYSPIFYLLQHVPVFNLFRFADRWMYVGSFFLAMVGGFGFDALRQKVEPYYKKWFITAAVPIGLFIILLVGFNFASKSVLSSVAEGLSYLFVRTLHGFGPFTKSATHYGEAINAGLLAWKEFVSFADPNFLIPTLSLICALALLWVRLQLKVSAERFVLISVLLTVIIATAAFARQMGHAYPRAALANAEETTFLQFIPTEDRAQYRYYPFSVDTGYRVIVPPTYRLTSEQINALSEVMFQTGWPNIHFNYGISSIDGYDVFVPKKYIDVLTLIGSTFGAQDNTRGISVEEKKRRVEEGADIIGMMNAKYVVSGVPLESERLLLVGVYPISRWNIPEYVYENTLVLPRAYIVKRAVEAKGKTLPELVQAQQREFHLQTYLDCNSCATNGSGAITASAYRNGEARFAATLDRDSWLVYSESNLPGWRARIDGNEAEIVGANGLYMAVRVPSGSHTVEFVYNGQLNRGI